MSSDDLGFDKLGLLPILVEATQAAYPTIQTPTIIQQKGIVEILAASESPPGSRGDVLLRSRTGSGKTLAFVLPILNLILQISTESSYSTSDHSYSDHIRASHENSHQTSPKNASSRLKMRKDMRSAVGTVAIILAPTRELAAQTESTLQAILGRIRGKNHWIVSGCLTGGGGGCGGGGGGGSLGKTTAGTRKGEKERLRRGMHIVVGTPGRVLDHLRNTSSWASQVSKSVRWLVIDEADRLLDSGFAPDVAEIASKLGVNNSGKLLQTVMCSATASLDPSKFLSSLLGRPNQNLASNQYVRIVDTSNNTSQSSNVVENRLKIEQSLNVVSKSAVDTPSGLTQFYICPPTRLRLLVLICLLQEQLEGRRKGSKIVLYTICCDTVDFIHRLLTHDGSSTPVDFGSKEVTTDTNQTKIRAKLPLITKKSSKLDSKTDTKILKNLLKSTAKVFKMHGGMAQKERAESCRLFSQCNSKDEKALLVCTDVAARGLNLEGVTCIIQFDAPCDTDDYIHRAGRTARQEEIGRSILFLMPSEKAYLDTLEARISKTTVIEPSIPQAILDADGVKKSQMIGKIKWDPLVEKIAKTIEMPSDIVDTFDESVKTKATKKPHGSIEEISKNALEDSIAEENYVNTTSVNTRRRIQRWIEIMQKAVVSDAELFRLASAAFLSFTRAYATHPAREKDIFHVKKLHLGHLATAFLLADPPKRLGSKHFLSQGNSTSGQPDATSSPSIDRTVQKLIDPRIASELGLNSDGSKRTTLIRSSSKKFKNESKYKRVKLNSDPSFQGRTGSRVSVKGGRY